MNGSQLSQLSQVRAFMCTAQTDNAANVPVLQYAELSMEDLNAKTLADILHLAVNDIGTPAAALRNLAHLQQPTDSEAHQALQD